MWSLQHILVYLAVAASVAYLVKKYFLKPKSKKERACGMDDCGCH